ncbi:MAG: ABC transporter substrate-binding protein [Planctomycetota bacterium]|nr:ABC transporter substrate-binding protein [Planctomycetota bacterium]MDP7559209.1 ABC transporter substrate-binding protein [Planctomycetota bacterium]|tara:strand:- start:7718 stop:8725 length:1008 start_codon:yes stop_codon:yes gene_type:complete
MRKPNWTATLPLLLASCGAEADLVVYCSLDQVHSEKIIQLFEERSGLNVSAQWDVEANKTIGMVNRLLAEKSRPHADVYWNNEIAQTLRLKRAGVTAPYFSPSAQAIPASFKDSEGHWTGFAARARVFLYREDLPGQHAPPPRVESMLLPEFAPHGGLARPLTGTTLTHFSVLSQQQGKDAVLQWLREAKNSGLSFGPGNAAAMRRVCEGDFPWCLTDTDDAAAARRNGYPVHLLYPDQQEDAPGTLLIPNTACLILNAPHPENGKRFLDFLLSEEVEAILASADSEQIPLRPTVPTPEHIQLPGKDFRAMAVDWEAAALELEARQDDFKELFLE